MAEQVKYDRTTNTLTIHVSGHAVCKVEDGRYFTGDFTIPQLQARSSSAQSALNTWASKKKTKPNWNQQAQRDKLGKHLMEQLNPDESTLDALANQRYHRDEDSASRSPVGVGSISYKLTLPSTKSVNVDLVFDEVYVDDWELPHAPRIGYSPKTNTCVVGIPSYMYSPTLNSDSSLRDYPGSLSSAVIVGLNEIAEQFAVYKPGMLGTESAERLTPVLKKIAAFGTDSEVVAQAVSTLSSRIKHSILSTDHSMSRNAGTFTKAAEHIPRSQSEKPSLQVESIKDLDGEGQFSLVLKVTDRTQSVADESQKGRLSKTAATAMCAGLLHGMDKIILPEVPYTDNPTDQDMIGKWNELLNIVQDAYTSSLPYSAKGILEDDGTEQQSCGAVFLRNSDRSAPLHTLALRFRAD